MTRLTIVVPTYNRPEYLGECLASIGAQTYRDYRLVVLDNASTADYAHVLSQFEWLDLEYIRNAENIGAVRNIDKARAIGSETEYHILFHDDDLMHPEMLERQLAILDAHPGMTWVATECSAFNASGASPVEWQPSEQRLEVYETPDQLVRRFLQNVDLNFGSAMFRSAKSRGIPIRIAEFEIVADRVLLCDIAAGGPSSLIPEPLVRYRHHAAQDSHNPVFRERHALALMTYYRDLLPQPLGTSDRTLLLHHATNYLLHVRSRIARDNRIPLAELLAEGRAQGLFRWSAIDGQGIAALARIVGMGSIFDAARPALGRLKRRLVRGAGSK